MVKLRALIFGSVMYLYWGYPQRKNYASLDNILKIKFYILHSLAHIDAKDTNFIFGTPHIQYRYTQTNGHTQTHMDTDIVPLSHFSLLVLYMYAKETNFIFGMP